jgi:Lrp/AsnC family transcriptional regulator
VFVSVESSDHSETWLTKFAYNKLIGAVPLKNVTSRFAMEKIKSITALPVPAAAT